MPAKVVLGCLQTSALGVCKPRLATVLRYIAGVDTVEILGKSYTPRLLDTQLADALKTAGAVVIEGPRACGKTMTAVNAGASFVALDDPTTALW